MNWTQDLFQKFACAMSARRIFWVLFFLIMAIGVFARTWEYRKLPPGFNLDEASIGVDAYDTYKYGVDRNGVSYPTHFIAFGQEQNALYGYLLMPFIAVWGLKPIVVRLPMLIYGILTLPLVFFVTKRTFGEKLGLLSMYFVAISPWHILLSRWGIDVNFFPFVFTLGYASLLEATQDEKWFILACFFFALCFYIYGPSYFIVPFFLTTSLWILIRKKLISRQTLIIGLGLFCILAIPVGLFILINTLGLTSIHVGPITIPRLPSTPRFLSESSGFQNQLIQAILENLERLLRILLFQTDGLIYDVLEPYGYFYTVTFPLAVFGMLLLHYRQKSQFNVKGSLLLSWLTSCLIFGVLQPVSIIRLNIVFIPLIICIAVAVDWLGEKNGAIFAIAILGLLIGFVAFTIDFHGEHYRKLADPKFRPGLLSAIQFASSIGKGPICVTNEPDFPYIYVLFVEKPNPATYLANIEYADSLGSSRHVRSLLRYTFGKSDCANKPDTVYLLYSTEGRPVTGIKYSIKRFNNYFVFYPQP